MTIDNIAKIYTAIGLAYLLAWIFKLIRRKDGKSGWSRMKIMAEKDGVIEAESFPVLVPVMIAIMAFAWPIELAIMLMRKKKSNGEKP